MPSFRIKEAASLLTGKQGPQRACGSAGGAGSWPAG